LLAAGGAGTYAAERVNISRRTMRALSDGYSRVITGMLAGMTLPRALKEQEHLFFQDVAKGLSRGEAIPNAWKAETPNLPKEFSVIWRAAGEALAWPEAGSYFARVQGAGEAVKTALAQWEDQNQKRGGLWLKLGWLGGAALLCLLW